MKLKSIILVLCATLCWVSVQAQQEVLKVADTYFSNKVYNEALRYYLSAGASAVKDEIQYKLAICNYELNKLESAQTILVKLNEKNYKEKKVPYYLAKIAHNDGEFEKAIYYYKQYLRRIGNNDPDRKMIIGSIKRCANGLKVKYRPQLAFIENMGARINTMFDEYGVVQSKNHVSRFYLSSNRPGSVGGKRNNDGLKDEVYGTCFSDMYMVDGDKGIWKDVKPIGGLINSPQHDILHGFNEDGSVLFFSKSLAYDKTEVYVDTFREERTAFDYPHRFTTKIKGRLGDNSLQIYNDTTILFSSKRRGGYGGYDIYITEYTDGEWTEPYNLGPSINTAFDELSPFLANDGRKLFYSSNNEGSIGGYDIFENTYLPEQNKWSSTQNLGLPINSGNDDLGLIISKGGKTAIFSSDRKKGFGGKDIYIAYLKEVDLSHIGSRAQAITFINSSPTEALVSSADTTLSVQEEIIPQEVVSDIKVREYFLTPLYYGDDEFILNPTNLRQLDNIIEMMQLYPSIEVEFTCNTAEEGINAYELYFSVKRTEKLIEYLKKSKGNLDRVHVKGLGNNYPLAKEIKDGGSLRLSQNTNRRIDVIFHFHEKQPLELTIDYPELPANFKDFKYDEFRASVKGLSFKVEIAKVSQLYQNEILNNYDDACIEKNLKDNVYHYTLGLYNRYATAKVLREELQKNGDFTDAKVIPYINGLRIDVEDLNELKEKFPDLNNYIESEL